MTSRTWEWKGEEDTENISRWGGGGGGGVTLLKANYGTIIFHKSTMLCLN